jgi:hypothetical protein
VVTANAESADASKMQEEEEMVQEARSVHEEETGSSAKTASDCPSYEGARGSVIVTG